MNALIEKYRKYCELLGVQSVFQTAPTHTGEPHIEEVGGKFNYVVTERGREHERRVAKDEDEVLYWLLSDVVFALASNYELEHRVQGQSFRRLLFTKELELMGKLSPDWQQRRKREIENILAANPYDDVAEG